MFSKNKYYTAFVAAVLLTFLGLLIFGEGFEIVREKWRIAIVMLVGSFVAGSSPVGGGAVAFPALTLIFKESVAQASYFSLGIQSIGMTAATIYILNAKIKITKSVILPSLVAGIAGFVVGINSAPFLSTSIDLKLIFASIWIGFGFVFLKLKDTDKESVIINMPLLLITAFIGGVISSLFGSGIDMMVFSVICLAFGVSPKTAIPTSVILMAGISIFGVFYIQMFQGGFTDHCLKNIYTAAPVVVLGAPFGAFVVNKLGNKVITMFILLLIILQYIGCVIMTDMNSTKIVYSIATILTMAGFYTLISRNKKG